MATYVVSDLHGNYDLFLKGLEKINFSEKDCVYCTGDVIDKGPSGISLMLHIMKTENMDMVLGNHEFMMLNTVSPDGTTGRCNGRDSMLWLYGNGGAVTFSEYKAVPAEMRKELIEWLTNRKLSMSINVEGKEYVLTHSSYRDEYLDVPYAEIPYDAAWDIVWKSQFRDDVYCAETTYSKYPDKTFITGHVPVQRVTGQDVLMPYKKGNLINIDGGLAYGDYLKGNGAIFLNLDTQESVTVPLH